MLPHLRDTVNELQKYSSNFQGSESSCVLNYVSSCEDWEAFKSKCGDFATNLLKEKESFSDRIVMVSALLFLLDLLNRNSDFILEQCTRDSRAPSNIVDACDYFSALSESIQKEIANLRAKVKTLEARVSKLEQSNAKLEQSNAKLEQSNAKLEQSNAKLEYDNQQMQWMLIVGELSYRTKQLLILFLTGVVSQNFSSTDDNILIKNLAKLPDSHPIRLTISKHGDLTGFWTALRGMKSDRAGVAHLEKRCQKLSVAEIRQLLIPPRDPADPHATLEADPEHLAILDILLRLRELQHVRSTYLTSDSYRKQQQEDSSVMEFPLKPFPSERSFGRQAPAAHGSGAGASASASSASSASASVKGDTS